MLGIYPPLAKHQHQHPFNVKNLFSLVAMTSLFSCSFGYFLFQANSMAELGSCFYCTFSMLEALLFFIIIFLKIRTIVKFSQKLEEFIELSKCWTWFNFFTCMRYILGFIIIPKIGEAYNLSSKIVYRKLNRNIEQLSKWCAIVAMSSFFGVSMLPMTVMSLINYYVYDMADDSFYTFSPMMYVCMHFFCFAKNHELSHLLLPNIF